jgi:hypothetical protein
MPVPPGRYEVVAHALGFGLVTIPVVIDKGKRTIVSLQPTPTLVLASVSKSEAVGLAGDRIVGWRPNLAKDTTNLN